MSKTLATVLALATAASLGACTFDETYEEPQDNESMYSRLGTRETLTLEPTSLVGVAAYDDDGNPLPCLQPSVAGGEAVLRTTDQGVLVIEKMTIQLTDVVVEPGIIYSAPIHLTDIELRLGTQLAVEPAWADDDNAAEGAGKADLLLDWAVLNKDGDHLPLATQLLRRVDFKVEAYLDETGAVRLEVGSSVEGRIGGFANRIELSDFSMAVKAATPAVEVR